LKDKLVQAYDDADEKIYSYSDIPGDTLKIEKELLDQVRVKGQLFFRSGEKEVVAYRYEDRNHRFIMIAAGDDMEGKNHLAQLRKILWLSLVYGIIIALAGGYFFSRGLLKPLINIADEVNEISAQNLARRIQMGSSKDEWYYLSYTFNELLNRLQDSFDLQRRFISNASHELSTPLTSISSQLEVSLLKDRSPEEYRKVMSSILQDVRHMNKLTQTLLEFAKASGSSGGLEFHLIRVDEVLMRIPSELQKISKDYIVSLQFAELPEEESALLVFGNEELLFTALKNIVVNACKYSSDHKASIRFQAETGRMIIHIEDHGVGIPEEELEHIFQPFYRVEEDKKVGGFGLGLSLASRIIKLHKGEIQVTSKRGEGTSFTVKLPAAGWLS
jgi:signal transduction histidine kinase